MEGILALVGIWVVFWLIAVVLRHAGAATRAAVRAASGKGSFSENLEVQLKGMGPLSAKVEPTKVDLGGTLFDALEVKVRGLINAPRVEQLALTTSIFDFTLGEYSPVLCSVDAFQEPRTRAYQQSVDAGEIRPNQGYPVWITVATVFPASLTGEYSGRRKLKFLVRALPPGEVPKIELGLHEKDTDIFSSASVDYDLVLDEKGYAESADERRKAKALSVKIAVAVAMANGQFSHEEGRVIQTWIRREVEATVGSQQESIKKLLNDSLRDAYTQAQKGALSQDYLLSQLKALDLKAQNFELLQLCLDIIGSESDIDADGLRCSREIAATLGIDYEEFQAMSDKKLLEVKQLATSDGSVEALLGIDPSWDAATARAHLRAEFLKWNGRIQTLTDGEEKLRAQKMLDAIADARTKYDLS